MSRRTATAAPGLVPLKCSVVLLFFSACLFTSGMAAEFSLPNSIIRYAEYNPGTGLAYISGQYNAAIPGILPTIDGTQDLFVACLNMATETPTVVWATQISTNDADIVYGLKHRFTSGSTYIGLLGTGGIPGFSTNNGGYDIIVIKLTSSGAIAWVHQPAVSFFPTGNDQLIGLEVDVTDTHIYSISIIQDGSPYVEHLDNTGTVVATNRLVQPATIGAPCNAGALSPSGDRLYILMRSTYTGYPGHTGGGLDTCIISIYTSNLTEEWARCYGSTTPSSTGDLDDFPCGLYVDPSDGMMYVTGMAFGSFPGYTNQGNLDASVLKVEPTAGVQQWAMLLPGTFARDECSFSGAGMTIKNGIIYAVFNSEGQYPNRPYSGGKEIGHARLDKTTGNLQYYAMTGNYLTDLANGLFVDDALSVYVYGSTQRDFTNTDGYLWRQVFNTECPAGSYVDDLQKWTQCLSCPVGSVTSAKASRSCTVCPTGYGTNSDRSQCVECVAGQYTDTATVTCKNCPAGDYTGSARQYVCSTCGSGFYSSEGSSECTACALHTYAVNEHSSSCDLCPYDSTTESTASNALSMCSCRANQYGDPHGKIGSPRSCKNCDSGATCDGSYYQEAKRGFYLDPAFPDKVYECNPHGACPGGYSKCTSAYQGVGCFQCASGYFRQLGSCRECPTTTEWRAVLVPLALCAYICLTLGGTCLAWLLGTSIEKLQDYGKWAGLVFIMHWSSMQTVTYALSLGIDNPEMVFPNELMSYGLGIYLFDFTVLSGPVDCILGYELPMVIGYIGRNIQPLLWVVVVVPSASIAYFLTKEQGSTTNVLWRAMSGAFGAYAFVLSQLYFGILLTITMPFRCSKTLGTKYTLDFNSSLLCYSGDTMWIILMAVSIPLVLFSLGIPLLLLGLLIGHCAYKSKHTFPLPTPAASPNEGSDMEPNVMMVSPPLNSRNTGLQDFAGPLCDIYRPDRFYWELLTAVLKLVSVATLMITVGGPYDKGIALLSMCFVRCVSHAIAQPFRKASLNAIELFGLLVGAFVILAKLASGYELGTRLSSVAKMVVATVVTLAVLTLGLAPICFPAMHIAHTTIWKLAPWSAFRSWWKTAFGDDETPELDNGEEVTKEESPFDNPKVTENNPKPTATIAEARSPAPEVQKAPTRIPKRDMQACERRLKYRKELLQVLNEFDKPGGLWKNHETIRKAEAIIRKFEND